MKFCPFQRLIPRSAAYINGSAIRQLWCLKFNNHPRDSAPQPRYNRLSILTVTLTNFVRVRVFAWSEIAGNDNWVNVQRERNSIRPKSFYFATCYSKQYTETAIKVIKQTGVERRTGERLNSLLALANEFRHVTFLRTLVAFALCIVVPQLWNLIFGHNKLGKLGARLRSSRGQGNPFDAHSPGFFAL